MGMEKANKKKKRKRAATYRRIEHGFEPVFDARSRVLILGSFPSEASRKNNFYYGNAHNRFWRVVAACLGEPEPCTAEEKRAMLLRHGIALWDVIESCDIKGSSDASIKNVVPAHIERIIDEAPIGAVICNGATAARLYKKYLLYKTGIEATTLPSTSPANAAWSLERLVERWGEALTQSSFEYAVVPLPQKNDANSAPRASSYATRRSMQGNKRANTKPELLMRERLRAAGLGGYRLQWKVPGRPDVAWPGKKVALFINGCFWHRCPHCNPSMPKKNVKYWVTKFDRNVERDAKNIEALREAGWKTHVIWECQLKKNRIEATLDELFPQLKKELGK